uniref:Uncharacterized protein n=1 Tax=Utricularia reniformis TaxID=192314 RepID=A0A1Y0B4T0_9LAMI|nr:hypothetical protein AEK19_MT2192 [Utricularia reniformis]ART32339.1 hypothetical protein AEK19_MT2192 [Utricularia reniformis]
MLARGQNHSAFVACFIIFFINFITLGSKRKQNRSFYIFIPSILNYIHPSSSSLPCCGIEYCRGENPRSRVCKYRMHRLSHSINNFLGPGLMKLVFEFLSGDPLENDYQLLMGRDLPLGFDAPQWRSPE